MNETILIVDDEPGIRSVLSVFLADIGHPILTAGNGPEALTVFTAHTPPIVVVDIRMPGMDGIEVLRRIKAERPDTEVIVISGHGDMDQAIEALKLRAADFIVKPINTDALEVAILRARERIAMRAALAAHTENLETQVSDARLRYEELFHAVPCFITLQDRTLAITDANDRFRAEFGDRVGERCYRAYKDFSGPCPECPVQKTFADGRTHETEMTVTNRTGEPLRLLVQTAPLHDPDGRLVKVIEVATDITQVHRLREHLVSLGLLIGSVSHSIKGLLTGLDGGMYILNSGIRRDRSGEINEGRDIIAEMAGRIRRAVLDILYYAKERDLDFEPVDPTEFVEDLARAMTPRCRSRKIRLDTRVAEDVGGFHADRDALHSALLNFLDNAVDACVAANRPDPRIIVELAREGESIGFEIADNGVGMDASTQKRIFELFFSTKARQGTGLGLFIARKIISQHGGRIDVRSAPGAGTRFCITLPAKPTPDDG